MPRQNNISEPEITTACLTTDIENLIRSIRGKQVMLDRDLSMLYGVETKALNQAVKRNISRFPEDFMFQLTKEENDILRSQLVTIETENTIRSQIATIDKRGRHVKYLPYAFTENGIAMLSSVLRSQQAIETNILIMRAFSAMRHFIGANAQIFQRMEIMEQNQLAITAHIANTDNKLEEVLRRLNDGSVRPLQGIFFDGQIFDAYTFVADLLRSAKTRIVLFDNYIDESVLNLLDKRSAGVTAIVYTKLIDAHLLTDIARHDAQYPHIDIVEFQKSHDRFLCIDNTVYHIGASLKDLGKRWFAFSRMEITTDKLLSKL